MDYVVALSRRNYHFPSRGQSPSSMPSDSRKNQNYSANRKKSKKDTSIIDALNRSDSTHQYKWDKDKENDDETKRLNQLLTIWDAERIAILKLQHDLDKNVFQRTVDYVKRIGQSIGLGLWLWVHRPADCSNIASLYQQSPSPFSSVDNNSSADMIVTAYPETQNYLVLEKNDDQEREESLPPSIDTLPDSLWLKHFVLDEAEEYLPPIARGIKNMLDNNALIWTSANQKENLWPHFINQNRVKQNKNFLRNMYGANGKLSSSSKKSSPSKIKLNTRKQRKSPRKRKKKNRSKSKNKKKKIRGRSKSKAKKKKKKKKLRSRSKSKAKKKKRRGRSKSKHRRASRRSKSKKKKKRTTARTVR